MNSRHAFVALSLIWLVGCGDDRPKLVPAAGTLTHNGKTLTAGSLTFHPVTGRLEKGDRPSCQLQADGSFTAATYPYGSGVVPGQYRVTLSPELAGRIKRPLTADPVKTPLTIDVPDVGTSDLRLTLN